MLHRVEIRPRDLESYREWVDAETFAGLERVGAPEGLQGAIPSKRYPLIGDGVAEILRSFAQLINSFWNPFFWNFMLAVMLFTLWNQKNWIRWDGSFVQHYRLKSYCCGFTRAS